MNHNADIESDTPRTSGFGVHILCVLVVLVPTLLFLYPIIVFVSDPFGGNDERADVNPSHAFSQLTGWQLPSTASILESTNSHSGFKNDGDYVLIVNMPPVELQSLLESDPNTWLDCPLAPEIVHYAWSLPVHSGTQYYGKRTSESDTNWHRGHVVIVNPESGMVWVYELASGTCGDRKP